MTFFYFVLNVDPGHRTIKTPKIKYYKQKNKSFNISILFYLEDDDGDAVDVRGQTVTSTLLLIKV